MNDVAAGSRAESTRSHRLTPLLAPRSIAFVGASAREGTVGNQMVKSILAGGYSGALHLVNPKYAQVEGRACMGSLHDLETPPDLVVAGVGSAAIEGVVDDALDIGARAITIFDACRGMDANGRSLVSRLAAKTREADVPVCGGNGMGFLDIPGRCHVSFYSAEHVKPGAITLIAHSGSVFTVLALNDPRYRFDLLVSPGQEIGATMDEYLDYALERPGTRVVALFMEVARDPAGFASALQKASARATPVVVCKVGRTEESARLARSHSGALAGNQAAYDAAIDYYGALRVDTVDQLMNTALLFSQGRQIGTGGVGFVTDSGGLREALIDRAHERDVPLARLDDATRAKLADVLPEALVPSNPLDAAGDIVAGFSMVFEKSLGILADAPEIAMLGYEFDARDDHVYDPRLGELALALPQSTTKPCFAFSSFANANNRALADRLADAGLPMLNGQDEMLSAVASMLRWRDVREYASQADPVPVSPPEHIVEKWRTTLGNSAALCEADGLRMLEDFGIAGTAFRIAETASGLTEVATTLGFPLALKTAADGIEHKADVDGVRLGLRNLSELRGAYADVGRRLGERVIVQRMAPEGVELAFGCVVDVDFGPLVMVASGGTLVELLSDRSFSLCPFGPRRARHLLQGLQAWQLLTGVRGKPPCDIDALCRTLSAFSVMCSTLADVVSEVDVNPLIVNTSGSCAVDALVIAAKKEGRTTLV